MQTVKQKMKFYLVLPLLVIPFICIAFWLMGGGTVKAESVPVKQGLNASLPVAVNDQRSVDKLGAYQAASVDSVRMVEEKKKDPYFQGEKEILVEEYQPKVEFSKPRYTYTTVAVEELKKQEPVAESKPDPEMEAINHALDKLMAIQQPVKEKTVLASDMPGFNVVADEQGDETYFGRSIGKSGHTFLDAKSDAQLPGNIIAVISAEQVLQTGSVVKLQLRNGISIKDTKVAAGTNLYGYATLNGERLQVHIPSIISNKGIIPVSLSVYDMDGLEGIHVPGSLTREVMKETAEKAVESTGFNGFDLSLKTQAASAGVGAAQRLLSRKVKQVRVTVAAGYQVLLVDKNQK